jgi:hypothetical protein
MTPIIGFDVEWCTDPEDPARNIILSYQYAVRAGGAEWSGIIYTRPAVKFMRPDTSEPDLLAAPERASLGGVMAQAIARGIKAGHLRKWPEKVIAAAHWTRADLSAMTDFNSFKRIFSGVHKTYVSLNGQAYSAVCKDNKRRREFKIILVDTMLLSPGNERSLKALAPLYGEEKLDPGVAPDGARYIEHMDRLLVDNPELFKAYAIKDAEICAKHVEAMLEFVTEDLGLELKTPPVTIGSIGVHYAMKLWDESGISLDEMNGVVSRVKGGKYNVNAKRYITKEIVTHHTKYTLNEELVKSCYLGGRNECFAYGPTANMQDPRGAVYTPIDDIPVTFREFDLKAAYATAMASLQIPDYEAARLTTDPADFKPDEMGFACLRFQFPPTTRFPCLPVVSTNEHGLIYPLSGEAYVTAPEIALARHMGAEITILQGVIVPWVVNSLRPYEMVIKEFARRRAEHADGTVQNALYKLLGNSLYGKIGQGLKDKTVFDTTEEHLKLIPPSKVTNPFLVAHVTGLVRALVSEFIASIPDRWTVLYLATDGFITNCPLGEISTTGPIAQHLSCVRERIDGPALLEQKAEVDQVIVWRTRGVATLEGKGKPKLAKGGMRAPEGVTDWNAWFAETMLIREHGQTYLSSEPLSFPVAHRTNNDFIHRPVEKRMNFEFDFKRRPVDPTEISTHGHRHLSFATIPWQTVDEFNTTREQFERWHQQGGCLKTMADFRRWEEFQAGAIAAKAGIHRRVKSGLCGQALRIVLHAYSTCKWGLPGGQYKAAAAALSKAGYPTKEQDFKNARRTLGPPKQHVIPAAAAGIRELVITLVEIWPTFEWQKLVRHPWEGYLEPAISPAGFSPNAACGTPLRGAETLEGFKFAYRVIQRNETSRLKATGEMARTPEEVAENDALCEWLFGRRWVKPNIKEIIMPAEFSICPGGRSDGQPPHLLPDAEQLTNSERAPKPLSFAAMLREDDGDGVLLEGSRRGANVIDLAAARAAVAGEWVVAIGADGMRRSWRAPLGKAA